MFHREVDEVIEGSRKARILIIEDKRDVRHLLSHILEINDHEVDAVAVGSHGIDRFQKQEYDLVFTDLGMPGMSGWQVAKKIKSINSKVPVIVITGWKVEISESAMKEKWVDFILHKPFEVTQVLKVVQEGMVLRVMLSTQHSGNIFDEWF